MEQNLLKIVYCIGFILIILIRLPYWRSAKSEPIVVDHKTVLERILLALLSIGIGAFPLVYIFTPFLDAANYTLPSWAGWSGVVLFAISLWILWRAHLDLGRNWSHWLQLRQGHQLITSGIYRYIRHPMYASGWLVVMAQALLLQNWIVCLSGLVSYVLFYFHRVPREEQMMLEQFGEEYWVYMKRTGRVIPRLKEQP